MDRQRLGTWGTTIFAGLAAIGMLIQVYLIAGYLFGEGTGWLDAHQDFGKIFTHPMYILTFLAALVGAWPNWRAAAWPFGLAVLGSIQAFLAGGDMSGAVHAFHGALVPIVFVLAIWIGWRSYTELGIGKSSATAAP